MLSESSESVASAPHRDEVVGLAYLTFGCLYGSGHLLFARSQPCNPEVSQFISVSLPPDTYHAERVHQRLPVALFSALKLLFQEHDHPGSQRSTPPAKIELTGCFTDVLVAGVI